MLPALLAGPVTADAVLSRFGAAGTTATAVQSPIFPGLAWSLIFELLASTAFALVVAPVAYFTMVPPGSSR